MLSKRISVLFNLKVKKLCGRETSNMGNFKVFTQVCHGLSSKCLLRGAHIVQDRLRSTSSLITVWDVIRYPKPFMYIHYLYNIVQLL